MYCELEENIILRFLSHKSYHFANLSRINSRYLKTYQAVTILKPYSTFQGLNCFLAPFFQLHLLNFQVIFMKKDA